MRDEESVWQKCSPVFSSSPHLTFFIMAPFLYPVCFPSPTLLLYIFIPFIPLSLSISLSLKCYFHLCCCCFTLILFFFHPFAFRLCECMCVCVCILCQYTYVLPFTRPVSCVGFPFFIRICIFLFILDFCVHSCESWYFFLCVRIHQADTQQHAHKRTQQHAHSYTYTAITVHAHSYMHEKYYSLSLYLLVSQSPVCFAVCLPH